MSNSYDVAVIGAGPGGYVAAIKLAQKGKKVVCIDKRGNPGGTCLNVGCIPSKTLLQSTHKYHDARHLLAEHGIIAKDVTFSLEKMMMRKDNVVNDLAKGILNLFKKNKVEYLQGEASFLNNNSLLVKNESSSEKHIYADDIIIASGSQTVSLPGIKIDEEKILSSTGSLSLTTVPENMIVVGAGAIGLEMASVWSRLGSKVTVIEYAKQILPSLDLDIAQKTQKILEKQGISFVLNGKVEKVIKNDQGLSLFFDQNNEKIEIKGDVLLMAVGRKPYTDKLNLNKTDIELNKHGQIVVNANFKTSVPNIYAIGDVIAGPMLAHKASEEGYAVAEIICSDIPVINYNNIPSIVYTYPEIAVVGKVERELKEENIDYLVGRFPLMANSRSRTNGELDGEVKILVNKKTDRILGASIVAANAGDLIQEIVIAMEFKASSEDIARICFGHPSVSESIKEASLAAFDKPIHI